MRRHAKVLFAIAVVCSFFTIAATPAFADYAFKGTFTSAGSGDGELDTPGRAAVGQSSGNLFVVDSGNNRVQVFAPNGSGTADYLTQFGSAELSAPWGIAIDEDAGQTYVYVADAGNEEIVKYDSDEAGTPTFTVDPGFTSPAKGSGAGEVGDFHAALAIDPTTHELLVADEANKRISRLEADGTPDGSFDGSAGAGSPGTFSGPIDVAVNSSGDVYVIDANGNIAEQGGTSKALRYSGPGEYKSTLPAVGTHERVATVAVSPFDDSVVVSGDQDNVYEGGPPPFQPPLGVFDTEDNPLPSPILNASAQYDTVAGLAIASDSADHLYVVLGRGSFGGTPYGNPQIQTFRSGHPSVPTIVNTSASPGYTEARSQALIHPGKLETKYHFEYGATVGYGQRTGEATVPAGDKAVVVNASLVGLQPDTSYHFRVVASNSMGSAEGPDQVMRTSSSGGADNCPNAAIRARQQSGFLAGCRAYEKVTPDDKNGSDMIMNSPSAISSLSGDKIISHSFGAFAGAQSSITAAYLSERDPRQGWQTTGIAPPQSPGFAGGSLGGSYYQAYSSDLRFATLNALDPILVPGAQENARNMYRRELDGSKNYDLLTPAGGAPGSLTFGPYFAAASNDFSHIIFETSTALTPDAPGGEVVNLYEWTGGETRLVGILPNGQPAPAGSAAGPAASSYGPGATGHNYTLTTISDDGSRIFWSDLASGQLYVRINGTTTVHVSASQRTIPDPVGPKPTTFQVATPDGRFVFFTSAEKLTDDSTAGDDLGVELYRYDVQSGQLLDLSVGGEHFTVVGMPGVGDDGTSAYFAATGNLLPGPADDGAEDVHIYRWHGDDPVEYVTSMNSENTTNDRNWPTNTMGQFNGVPKLSRVTPDGKHLLLVSLEPLTDFDNTNPVTGESQREVYLFDAVSHEMTCVSCNRTAAAVTAGANVESDLAANGAALSPILTRIVSPDGSRVYFNTPESLVRDDRNGEEDVYLWEEDRVSLISSGQASTPSYLAEASGNGSDVFFFTSQQLVASDRDNNIDVYDARVGGGFDEPRMAPTCAGESCRGTIAVPAPAAAPGSSTVAGAGNPKARRHKASRRHRHKHRRRNGHKRRAHKHTTRNRG